MRFGIIDSVDVVDRQPCEVVADRMASANQSQRLGSTSNARG
jgi:hypothetical protein